MFGTTDCTSVLLETLASFVNRRHGASLMFSRSGTTKTLVIGRFGNEVDPD